MKNSTFTAMALFLSTLFLNATSVGLECDECPICQKNSHYVVLRSFSNFGEPSRDFLDSPIFAFSGPRICPWDLFVSHKNDWKIEDKDQVAKLRAKLGSGSLKILLTPGEGRFLEEIKSFEDPDAFLELRKLWWVRTLGSPLSIEERIAMTMKMFSKCQEEASPFSELREVYRVELLRLFRAAVDDEAISKESRYQYRYLHAEFLRKGKEFNKASKGFAALEKSFSEMTGEQRDELEPLVTWTKEQFLRLRFQQARLQELISDIKTPLPNPFRDDLGLEEEGEEGNENRDLFLKHRWALEELTRRSVGADPEASEKLWKLLKKDVGSLLALAETLPRNLTTNILTSDEKWREWRTALLEEIGKGDVPEAVRTEINQERNLNILGSVLRSDAQLGPFAEEANTPEGRLRAALTVITKGSEEEAVAAVEIALKELQKLTWQEAAKEDMFSYPLQYLSKAFALSEGRYQAQLKESLAQPWKDPFFKEMTRLWMGEADSLQKLEKTAALQAEQKYAGYGAAQMVYFYLEEQKNPAWRERCLKDLQWPEMINDRVLNYAEAIFDAGVKEALLKRHQLRSQELKEKNQEESNQELTNFKLKGIESLLVRSALLRLPIAVKGK